MALAFNEEQRSVKKTARDFAHHKSPVEAFRKLRAGLLDGSNLDGFDKQVWQEIIELGWTGMPFPENYGGFDFGYMGLAACMEELGRTLTASPLLSSVLLSGSTILYAGTEEQKTALIPKIVSGETLFALALDEGAHHNPSHIETTALLSGNNYVLNGKKTFVIDGHIADQLIIVARTSGKTGDSKGISLFIVDSKSKGVSIERVNLIDSRGYAQVTLKELTVAKTAVLGTVDEGFAGLDKALDRARICLAAEMLAGVDEIFTRTIDYLKERKQFGVLIGTFQALQHRAAHLYTQIQMCRSSLMSALDALDGNKANFPQLCSGTKALIADTYELVSNEAVQMHGGIGVTDELDIGLFLKRARVSAALLGSAQFHYDRFATLEGY
jgi:alkylation response protein AidB-like acyl-CoA dehydrogenase